MSETLTVKRCAWALSSQQYLDYHDKEWGVPVHDDRKLFEQCLKDACYGSYRYHHLWLNRRSQSIHRARISFAFQRTRYTFRG